METQILPLYDVFFVCEHVPQEVEAHLLLGQRVFWTLAGRHGTGRIAILLLWKLGGRQSRWQCPVHDGCCEAMQTGDAKMEENGRVWQTMLLMKEEMRDSMDAAFDSGRECHFTAAYLKQCYCGRPKPRLHTIHCLAASSVVHRSLETGCRAEDALGTGSTSMKLLETGFCSRSWTLLRANNVFPYGDVKLWIVIQKFGSWSH